MGLIQRLLSRKPMQKTAPLAAEVARRSQGAVAERVRSRILWMSVAEARGYIRARAGSILRTEADAMLGSPLEIDSTFRASVIEQAMERVIGRLLGQRMQQMPAAGAYRRAA